jgi:phosphatidyl-myo-inositol dimannoside synthase
MVETHGVSVSGVGTEDAPINVVLCLAAAKIAEPRIASYQRMLNARVVLIGDESRAPAPNLVRRRAWKMPYLGAPERWTAALSWFRDLKDLDLGAVDCVMSLELYNPTSIQANRLARRFGVPHVVTVAEVLVPSPLYSIPPWRQVSRKVSRSADAFLCSVDMARRSAIWRGCPPERCTVISPGVDLERFHPRAHGLAEEPVVVFVGELREDKGIRDVIAAAEMAREKITDLRLIVAGDGPLRDEVRTQARRRSFIDYRGRVQRDELPGVYRDARCFVLAPRTRRLWAEQFGFASVEAMASGLPVVITDSGAVPDVVPPWNPICPQGDVGALAEGLVQAVGSAGAQWGAQNRQHAHQCFDDRRQAAQLRQWLRGLMVKT